MVEPLAALSNLNCWFTASSLFSVPA